MAYTRRRSHPAPMTPLQRLIEDVRDSEAGLSYTKLAKRSERPDGSGGLSRGRLQQLATQPVRRGLDIETREALARALRMPVSVINDALSSSVGTFNDRGDDLETRRLLALVDALPADRFALWFRLARAIADALAVTDEREATVTDSSHTEVSVAPHEHEVPLPPVSMERLQLTTDIAAVLGRLGEVARSSPELREELTTFSEQLFRRFDEEQTGE